MEAAGTEAGEEDVDRWENAVDRQRGWGEREMERKRGGESRAEQLIEGEIKRR